MPSHPGGDAPEGETRETRDVSPADAPVNGVVLADAGDGVRETGPGVPVVGIGASTGGLRAFLEMLGQIPPDTGLAFVFVAHAPADHVSGLPDLLAAKTAMAVRQAGDGMAVEPNTVYTNPPDRWVTVDGDVLRATPRPTHETPLMSVNVLLRSLAASRGPRAIAVILSGTAGDGAEGAREVADAGGFVLVQSPETCEEPHMPEETLLTGMAHLVLPPADLGDEVVRLARHPYLTPPHPGGPAAEPVVGEQSLVKIFALLRAAHGVDFSQYKPPTIRRRMHRRMALHRIDRVEAYLDLLQRQPEEVGRLFDDILIHVTRFFRDPETYEALAARVFPEVFADRGGEPVRVWIPGCSTGEETYSVAMALLEFLGDRAGTVPIQIFSTDVSERAVERARAGVYPECVAGDLSRERLNRFFVRSDAGYRVRQNVREMCVFARQDLTRDPPFSRLDLIVCRNVLIYLAPPAQKRLMGIFHYALRPGGFLMLGTAETVGQQFDLFTVVDKKSKLYATRSRALRPAMEFPPAGWPAAGREPPRHRAAERPAAATLHAEAVQVLLHRYAPPGVIVDDDMAIVQFRGQTGLYLEPAPGEPSLNLLKMARPGLLHALRAAVDEARERNAPARREGLQVRLDGHGREAHVEVTPLAGGGKRHFLVTFEDATVRPLAAPPPAPVREPEPPDGRDGGPDDDRVRQLERELAASRDYLQSIIQDLEGANEELQSANEEVLSSNEELQSTNEELDTAKEELQSTNEELNTVNEELHDRNDELVRVNGDLTNLLASVEIAIVMVDDDLRIRRFTPMAGKLLNLIPGDVGRSIAQIKPNVDCPDVEGLIRGVIDDVRPTEREVRDAAGRWYSLRVRPYKDLDRRISGAVLSLFDVDELRRKEAALAAARDLAEATLDLVRQPLVVLDATRRTVRRANRAFGGLFGVGPAALEGQPLNELSGTGWDAPELWAALEPLISGDGRSRHGRLEYDFPQVGRKSIRVTAPGAGLDGEALVLIAVEEPQP